MAANHDGGTVFMAFTLGALTGAAFALLLAPAAGEETRRYLESRAREGADLATDKARHVGERVREGRVKAGEAVKQGKEFLDRKRESISAAVEQGREAYAEARGKGAE